METLDIGRLFGGIYKGKPVLVTGHTGFKGSWLSLWLERMGAKVFGYSQSPLTSPSHYELLNLGHPEVIGDVCDYPTLLDVFREFQPEIVFHLAAQPLVRASYADPLLTLNSNVMGTANILEAVRQTPSVSAAVIITSDKCYENVEWDWGYREADRLGGHDPYSVSKACAELVATAYRRSFFSKEGSPLIASCRAGNVVGGGDWSEDRLIPDIVRAITGKTEMTIRNPGSTRPWQHVLECLSGYLLLGQRLLEGRKQFVGAWNFGPQLNGNLTVEEVVRAVKDIWPDFTFTCNQPGGNEPHEAKLLYLDSTRARRSLNWRPVWSDVSPALEKTIQWYKDYYTTGDIVSKAQLLQYAEAAVAQGMGWTEHA
ncbi:CDP-glucose 4,6-dehydratase [Pseudodesulfovibrio indicus]|uniref:CDP-glucose 4,6-dehydratase n=1 Tax=Pseudodesulfovibrio indicus TaxID=1716143 RepID=A0A126QN81_9BACT|nr:CDP-glucose 4,6-dehydratase [Pseudodesulfovibrio indicus]AMK11354.1 CDP-glucose 4,6-dehydratase [Pseudodesulfovibrio indicus]TDT89741.1 CDP-glucose 4,6-dehydratase [Pseudodesulfovibrio indicus]